ncbi:MAG: hypothetical protein ACYC9L_02895 [Sulfuricaulis sp.]
MPRGEKSSHPHTLAKRAETYRRKRVADAQRRAERVLRRWVPDERDAASCVAWLTARRIDLADPELQQASRLRWLLRARRTMAPHAHLGRRPDGQ